MADGEGNFSSDIFNKLYLGSEEFIKKMEKRFGVKNIKLGRGRPKKDKK